MQRPASGWLLDLMQVRDDPWGPPVQFLGHLTVTTKHCPMEIERFQAGNCPPPAFGRYGGVRHAKAGIWLVA